MNKVTDIRDWKHEKSMKEHMDRMMNDPDYAYERLKAVWREVSDEEVDSLLSLDLVSFPNWTRPEED